MLLFLLLYSGVGVGLAIATLSASGFRRVIDDMADRAGFDTAYGRKLWLAGTITAWPIGLFVLATGRLIFAGNASRSMAISEAVTESPKEKSIDEYGRRARSSAPIQTERSAMFGKVDAKPKR